jgi:hypothetical protein
VSAWRLKSVCDFVMPLPVLRFGGSCFWLRSKTPKTYKADGEEDAITTNRTGSFFLNRHFHCSSSIQKDLYCAVYVLDV